MDNLSTRGRTEALSSGLLTATGAETVVDTTAQIDVVIDGVIYPIAAMADEATPTTDINTGAAFVPLQPDKTCFFVYMLNSAGTLAVAQSEIRDVDPDADTPVEDGGLPPLPSIPDGYCPFAVQRVQSAGTSSAWTFGTSNWNATGITDVILNIATMPSRPPSNATA